MLAWDLQTVQNGPEIRKALLKARHIHTAGNYRETSHRHETFHLYHDKYLSHSPLQILLRVNVSLRK